MLRLQAFDIEEQRTKRRRSSATGPAFAAAAAAAIAAHTAGGTPSDAAVPAATAAAAAAAAAAGQRPSTPSTPAGGSSTLGTAMAPPSAGAAAEGGGSAGRVRSYSKQRSGLVAAVAAATGGAAAAEEAVFDPIAAHRYSPCGLDCLWAQHRSCACFGFSLPPPSIMLMTGLGLMWHQSVSACLAVANWATSSIGVSTSAAQLGQAARFGPDTAVHVSSQFPQHLQNIMCVFVCSWCRFCCCCHRSWCPWVKESSRPGSTSGSNAGLVAAVRLGWAATVMAVQQAQQEQELVQFVQGGDGAAGHRDDYSSTAAVLERARQAMDLLERDA